MNAKTLETRHPGVKEVAQWFDYAHLPEPHRTISKAFHDLAEGAIMHLSDGPQLTKGLQKLLEAKDCFVRQSIADDKARKSELDPELP